MILEWPESEFSDKSVKLKLIVSTGVQAGEAGVGVAVLVHLVQQQSLHPLLPLHALPMLDHWGAKNVQAWRVRGAFPLDPASLLPVLKLEGLGGPGGGGQVGVGCVPGRVGGVRDAPAFGGQGWFCRFRGLQAVNV